jgi:hypothetical protein
VYRTCVKSGSGSLGLLLSQTVEMDLDNIHELHGSQEWRRLLPHSKEGAVGHLNLDFPLVGNPTMHNKLTTDISTFHFIFRHQRS